MPGQPSLSVLRSQSDERLVRLAREGHERAFEAIVERYRKSLLRACRRLLPEARAEDALQQALLAAWSALQRGDQVRELRPWLYAREDGGEREHHEEDRRDGPEGDD